MFRRLFLPVIAVLAPLSIAAAACSVSSADAFGDETAEGDAGAASDFAPTTALDSSASGEKNTPAVGNPICKVSAGGCWPDDDGVSALASGTSACAPSVPDGGVTQKTASADASTKVDGCRIELGTSADCAKSDGAACAACITGGADTRGTDGISCQTGDDCAPGFDCVDGDNGAVCRRYCCSGTCDGYPAANNGPTFCDVRSVNRANVAGGLRPNAPVCMPIKSCTLLEDGDCGEGETCAIVTDKGATGCVSTGKAVAGDSCDTEHCATGLTCLGSPGNRLCYQLCRTTGGAGCTKDTDTCTTSAAFPDTSYGICKTQH